MPHFWRVFHTPTIKFHAVYLVGSNIYPCRIPAALRKRVSEAEPPPPFRSGFVDGQPVRER